MSKKVTSNQFRKGLTYVQQGPDFMKMLTGSSAGNGTYKKPIGLEAKYRGEEGDENEDDDDETAHDLLNLREEERPTVVVLKGGKHLDERQAKNVLANLPPGLSEAQIQKRLADALNNPEAGEQDGSEEESEDDEPGAAVDANGKILFRKPKKSNKKKTLASTGAASSSIGSSEKKKTLGNFKDTLLAEAEAKKAATLKRKLGSSSTSTAAAVSLTTSSTKLSSTPTGELKKVKKQKVAKAKSLLSFEEDE